MMIIQDEHHTSIDQCGTITTYLTGEFDMPDKRVEAVVNDEFLKELFPPERADEFFEALYGGAEAGAFDISLRYNGFNSDRNLLLLDFRLTERPGKCLACNLTFGLPEVFKRHPVINVQGIVDAVQQALAPDWKVREWFIGNTEVISPEENSIPLVLALVPG